MLESVSYLLLCKKKVNLCSSFLFSLSPLLTLFQWLVPDKVGNLEANSNSSMKSLIVSWSPPAGDWEQYRIQLFNDSSVLLNTTVRKEETFYIIDGMGLIPGRQYEVEVTVESGNFKNSKRCQGRTGKKIL